MKPEVNLLPSPVEIVIIQDGKTLMQQTFQHTPIRIGRVLDNDIVLPFDSVSRHHCELHYSAGRWIATDLKSLNGIKVDGQKVTNAVFEKSGAFDLKPVTVQLRNLNPAAAAKPTYDSDATVGVEIVSSSDETIVDNRNARGTKTPARPASKTPPTPPAPAAPATPARATQKSAGKKVSVLGVDGLKLMTSAHPAIETAKKKAVQVTVLWHDILMSVDEFIAGEDMVIEISGIFLRLGQAGAQKSNIRCPSGTIFVGRNGNESVLVPSKPCEWESTYGLRIFARYVPQSRAQRTGVIPMIEEELLHPLAISGVVHGAVAIAAVVSSTPQKKAVEVPERVAKIIAPQPQPPPEVAKATPTPTPFPTPTATPIAKATPAPTPKPAPTAPPKKVAIKKVEQPRKKEVAAPAPQAQKPVHAPKPAIANRPPVAPKVEAPPAPTPKPFDAASVGALKALTMLSSAPVPAGANVEKIVVRKTANTEEGGATGAQTPGASALIKGLPVNEGGSANGQVGGLALPVTKGGEGYGEKGFSGKTGKRNVLGSVIGGAKLTEPTRVEGLTREQVMKIVQKHHTQIQQCYERSLMDDAGIAGRAEFEWEIAASGQVVGPVNVKETNLRGGEKLLECVKGVFKKMVFPAAKNGASTTPTIGLPFGRL